MWDTPPPCTLTPPVLVQCCRYTPHPSESVWMNKWWNNDGWMTLYPTTSLILDEYYGWILIIWMNVLDEMRMIIWMIIWKMDGWILEEFLNECSDAYLDDFWMKTNEPYRQWTDVHVWMKIPVWIAWYFQQFRKQFYNSTVILLAANSPRMTLQLLLSFQFLFCLHHTYNTSPYI